MARKKQSVPVPYQLVVEPAAKSALDLPEKIKGQIAEKIQLLLENPFRPRTKQLSGAEWRRKGLPTRRIRSGDYRILYVVDRKSREITIVDIGIRRDVYGGH